jgi:hypothetical protein
MIDYAALKSGREVILRYTAAIHVEKNVGNRKLESTLVRRKRVAWTCGSLKLQQTERGTNVSLEFYTVTRT